MHRMSVIRFPQDADGTNLQSMVDALTQAMKVWDPHNYQHCVRTSEYAAALCDELDIRGDEAEHVRIGALLHDVGKMAVDLAILRKPDSFDDEEWRHVKIHPAAGAEILARMMPQTVVDCAEYHHEQPDGRGYPHQLREHQIPLSAMICRVADVLDSLTTDQSYRPAMTLEEALAELSDGAGTRYSERVVVALFAQIERRRFRPAA
jgi:putative nucleotidyltransferase with HDIG domain